MKYTFKLEPTSTGQKFDLSLISMIFYYYIYMYIVALFDGRLNPDDTTYADYFPPKMNALLLS